MPSPTESSPVTRLEPSGNPLIDGLIGRINDGPPNFDWVSFKWGGAVGTGTTLTYSFAGPDSVFAPDYGGEASDVRSFPETLKENTRDSFAIWERYANVHFVEVQETPTEVGDIRFGVTGAYQDTPDGPAPYGGEELPFDDSIYGRAEARAGDFWTHVIYVEDGVERRADDMVHAIGHSFFGFTDVTTNVGLGGVDLDPALDFQAYTVMSYNSVPGEYDNPGPFGGADLEPHAPMLLDILAAQYLFGPNTGYNAGDTVYTYREDTRTYAEIHGDGPNAGDQGRTYETIWDGGGTDTIVYEAQLKGGTIDLRPGAFSDVGTTIYAAPEGGTPDQPWRTKTLAIAYGAVIENAVGGAQGDTLIGNDADNRLTGNGGDDTIEGGAGTDTAVFGGPRGDYAVSLGAETMTVAGEGADTLSGIERLAFTDGTLAFDTDGNAGQAYRIYQAAFDRVPDVEGLGYWIDELDRGFPYQKVVESFMLSEEFAALYGTDVSDEAFLTLLYNNVLDRDPDAEGFAYWMDELDSGFERWRVLASFAESVENQANVADQIADGIWFV